MSSRGLTTRKGVEKMQRAGADQVVSLYASGAIKMAHLLTNPKLGNFFRICCRRGLDPGFGRDHHQPRLGIRRQDVGRSRDFGSAGIIIVGIRRANGEVVIPPTGNTVIQPGDNLFALGDKHSITTADVHDTPPLAALQ